MITHPAFTVEPWAVTEDALDLDVLAQSESVFALSNGHIGLRGNLDEGEPFGLPGTYLNGFYETRPLPYAEAGYGYPEDGQTVVNATNGKIIRLLVDDEPFDIRYGELLAPHAHARPARGRAAARGRTGARPSGARDRGRLDPARLVRAALGGRDPLRGAADRRPAAARRRPVRARGQRARRRCRAATRAPRRRCARRWRPRSRRSTTCASCSSTARATSGLRMAAGMDHVVERLRRARRPAPRRDADLGRVWLTAELAAGHAARVHEVPRLRLVEPALAAVGARPGRRGGGVGQAHGLGRARATRQREYLDDFWERADVEIEGDGELQQAVRFALFHTLQAGARAERRAIPAKGLTGPGYDGHAFWDTRDLRAAGAHLHAPGGGRRRAALAPRDARPRAASARRSCELQGRRVPVAHDPRAGVLAPTGRPAPRRSTSTPTSPTRSSATCAPPATTAFEAGAGARAARARPRGCGARSATTTTTARFHIDGVTGPDEYSAIVDDNVYTNLMAEQNLRIAAELAAAPPGRGARARRRRGGDRRLARRRRRHARPVRRAARRAPAGRGLHPPRACWTSSGAASTRCCCTCRTSSSTARRWSSSPTSCSRCYLRGDRFTRRGEGARLRLLRADHRARLARCRRASRPSSPPRSGTSSWPTTTSARPR